MVEPPTIRTCAACRKYHLFNDLTGAELTEIAAVPGRAEATGHRAAGLGGDAHRGMIAIVHEHGLYRGTVIESKEPLYGSSTIGSLLVRYRQRRRKLGGLGEPLAECLGENRYLLDLLEALIERLLKLLEAKPRFARQECSDLLIFEVVTAHE
jgi:hypothetical protein